MMKFELSKVEERWGLGGVWALIWGDKEVTMQYLVLKGGDRGACKLLGDVMVMQGSTKLMSNMYEPGFRRSGRLKCKGPVIEENTIEDAINVEEYLSEDENISQDEGIQNIIGTQVDNKDVGPSTSGAKKVKSVKKGKMAKKRKIEDTIGLVLA
ncbi:hypothetical protein Tco_1214523 [Tanacetum coccineum]